MTTLVIADNHPVVRAGIRAMFSGAPDIQIVGEVENGYEAQDLVAQLRPRILTLDLKMPGPTPAAIGKWVSANFPETAVLVFTAHDHDSYLASLNDAGVMGILSQEAPTEKLIDAIRRAARGETLFDEPQLERVQQWRKVAGEKWEALSNRQRQISQLLAQGTSRGEVATRLKISKRALEFHIGNILERLKFKSLLEAVCWLHKNFPDDWDRTTG